MVDIAEKDRYVTIQWVATRLSCSEQHIYTLLKQGCLTAIRIGDRALRISEQSYDKYVQDNIIDPNDFYEQPEDKKSQGGKVAQSNWMNKK